MERVFLGCVGEESVVGNRGGLSRSRDGGFW